MRRESKFIISGALSILLIVVLIDLYLQRRDAELKGDKLTLQNVDYKRLSFHAFIAAISGGAIGYLYYHFKMNQTDSTSFNPTSYLNGLLSAESLKSNHKQFHRVSLLRNEIKNWLIQHFKNKLAGVPEDTGSFRKRTAISSNYDLDIILPFKRGSYNTLQAMFESVGEEIIKKFGKSATISIQTKAIKIEFENQGQLFSIDILPGREINNYAVDKMLNLYIKPDWIWQNGGFIKTNVQLQKSMLMNQPEMRRTIKTIKIYRDKNNIELPSIVIEQCVYSAFLNKHNFKSYSEIEIFCFCLKYISIKLSQDRLVDLTNSNNNLFESMSYFDRTSIAGLLKEDALRISKNPVYLKDAIEA